MYVTHSTVYSNVQYITHITIDLILQTLKSLQVFQVRIPGQGRARVGLRPEAAAQGSLPTLVRPRSSRKRRPWIFYSFCELWTALVKYFPVVKQISGARWAWPLYFFDRVHMYTLTGIQTRTKLVTRQLLENFLIWSYV
jgi:hypothetical protein